MQFVAQLGGAVDGDAWRATCRRVEAQGYTGISLADHFGAQFAPLVALAAAAAVTERCTLGVNVLANDFRHPAVLAKELATLDVLSGGRVVAGIGAGWMTADYTQTGLAFDRPGVRIERLVESLHVLRGLWGDGPFTFTGSHYRIDGLDGQPKPCGDRSIPVLVCGGAPRILGVAGRHADIVGLALDNRAGVMGAASGRSATAAATREKLAWVRAAASERDALPSVSVRVLFVAVTGDRWSAAAELGRPIGLDAAEVLESPHALVGSVDDIVDDLRRRRDEYGFDHYVVSQAVVDDLAPVVEALATEVG
jgi:probable F420-dependent oxidoreductase